MTGPEMEAAARIIWGAEWRGGLEDLLSVSRRNVLYFVDGTKPIGPGFEGLVIGELRRALLDPRRSSPGLDVIRRAKAEPAPQF